MKTLVVFFVAFIAIALAEQFSYEGYIREDPYQWLVDHICNRELIIFKQLQSLEYPR